MTSKLTYALFIALLLIVPSSAQTRRRAGAPKPSGKATAAKPAAKPTPKPSPAKTDAAPTNEISVVAPVSCGCEDRPLPEVLAVVNGVKIGPDDLSAETRAAVLQLQEQVVQARARELDLQINSILIEAEARKRGTTSAKLIESEIVGKAKAPTEADARAYYDQNRAQIEAQAGRAIEFSELRENIVAFLKEDRNQERAQQYAQELRAAADVKILVPEATPPANEGERARLLATVNGQRITSGDIEDSLRPLISEVQEQVYDLRRRDLELKINDLLLKQEAQKRKTTERALLESEVIAKVPVVTEEDALKFYNENKERIEGDFAQLKYQIIQYVQGLEEQKAEAAFAERMRKANNVHVQLAPPVLPAFAIATDDQPVKGNPSASVTVVKFTDFQCPSCAQAHPVLERLASEYGERVRVVVRDFPLTQHKDAFKAAEAAEAARAQGKYWEYIELLYRNQSALGVERLKQYASALGLDRAKFDAALDAGVYSDKVRRDIADGQRLRVSGTPTIFVNGRRASDASYEGLKSRVESELRAGVRK